MAALEQVKVETLYLVVVSFKELKNPLAPGYLSALTVTMSPRKMEDEQIFHTMHFKNPCTVQEMADGLRQLADAMLKARQS